MHKIIQQIVSKLEESIVLQNCERESKSELRIKPVVITILGQFALIVNQGIAEKIPLTATRDVDALFVGDWNLRQTFEEILSNSGLVLDGLSCEIWIPPESQYNCMYQSENLTIQALDPLYCLLSKAIKAPEKNRLLIKEALKIYGKDLADLISKYNGDVNYFEI